jgi:MFS family permease
MTFVITLLFLKEVYVFFISSLEPGADCLCGQTNKSIHTDTENSDGTATASKEHSATLRSLLTSYPVIISISNYALLALLNVALNSLLPLFFSMPISIGGLGFSPPTIGYIIGTYGFLTGFVQLFFFAKLVRALGERRMFINGMLCFLPLFALMPVMNWITRRNGGDIDGVVWGLIGVVILLEICMDLAYGLLFSLFSIDEEHSHLCTKTGAIFIFVTSSAPNKRSLGSTNGLSQTLVSSARAIGPAVATGMFSLSVEKNYLGGYAVYVFWILLACMAVLVAIRLPEKAWDDVD